MKFGVNIWMIEQSWLSSYDIPLEKALEMLKKHGCEGIEVVGTPLHFEKEKDIKEKLVSFGIKVCSVNGSTPTTRGFMLPDPLDRKEAIKHFKDCIDFAWRLEAEVMMLVPLQYALRNPYRPLAPSEKDWQLAVDGLKELGKYAGNLGVTIVIEPVCTYETYFINTVDQALELLDKVGLDNVKTMVDTYHINIEEARMDECIIKGGKNICHVHVKENNGGPAGKGHIDFSVIIKAFKEIGYNKFLVLEHYSHPDPETAIAQSVKHLKQYM